MTKDNYEIALKRATDVLGSKERAEEWLEKVSGTLSGSPKEILQKKEGLERVLRHIRSVELALNTD